MENFGCKICSLVGLLVTNVSHRHTVTLLHCKDERVRDSRYDTAQTALSMIFLYLITVEYQPVLRSALTNGSYAEMIHFFALSSAIQLPIQSYCCPSQIHLRIRVHGFH